MAEKIEPKKEIKVKGDVESQEDIEKEEQELTEQVESSIKNIKIDLKKPALQRYAELKVAVRGVLLRKSKAGYSNRYFYIPLKYIQAAFTRLELAFGLTSHYTQKRSSLEGQIFYDAIRTLKDVTTGDVVQETAIDITDLILNKVEPNQITIDYLKQVLNLRGEEPKDAWLMLFLNYFDPQKKGSYSTYFQRYTYFQLYDFQEVDYDDIEEKPQGKNEAKKSTKSTKTDQKSNVGQTSNTEQKNDVRTAKEVREQSTDTIELREKLKVDFGGRENISKVLGPQRKISTMNFEELQSLEKELEQAYPELDKIRKEKGETE